LNIIAPPVGKDIYFLDNTDSHNNLKELNENNVELYIDDVKFKFSKYFKCKIREKENYTIKLKFKILMKDCSYMFYNCNYISEIDLSSFNTKNITNMSYMFTKVNVIKNLDLSSFDTENVTDMSYMFCGFSFFEKEKLDLSKFDTLNVTNMSSMFCGCKVRIFRYIFI